MYHNLNIMAYQENKFFFYPQEGNPDYDDIKAKIIGWNWILDACNLDDNNNFRQEIKALRQMKNSTFHEISKIIYDVLFIKKNNILDLEKIKIYANSRIFDLSKDNI